MKTNSQLFICTEGYQNVNFNLINNRRFRFLVQTSKIYVYSGFLTIYNWNKVNSFNYYTILKQHPQLYIYCDWNKLDGWDLVMLLNYQPQLSMFCNWDKLNGYEWFWILVNRPEFSEHCDWYKLDEENWRRLLEYHPQFAEYRKF